MLIWLYVQEEVPGITVERTTPKNGDPHATAQVREAEPCGALHVPLPAARALDRGCAAQAARLPEEAGRQRADAVCAHVRRAWRWGSSQRGGGWCSCSGTEEGGCKELLVDCEGGGGRAASR
jgi:hypothetical protein